MGVRSRLRKLIGRGGKGTAGSDTMSDGFPAPRYDEAQKPPAQAAPAVPKPAPEPTRTVAPEAGAATDLRRPSESVKEADDKQARFMARARKGMLKFLDEQGGESALPPMHDYSERRYLLAHQGFSRLMESMVDAGYVDYDARSGVATITESGRTYMAS